MALILKAAWQGYRFVFEDLTDPRTNTWFLVARPYQGMTLLGVYLMFVLKWGPAWMKNRPAFNLDKVLIVYNAIQVLLCARIFAGSLLYAWAFDYRWLCEPVDFSTDEKALIVARYVYYYFLMKIFDLADTVFFVLRKKFGHVSFLHVYHHTGMVLLTWGAVTYYPGGHGTLIGVINSFVHVVMYAYYLLTVAVPSIKGTMWWKKYITQMQILQFLFIVVHMGTLVWKTDCAYPRWTAAVFLPQNIFMLILFIDFYIKAYIKPKKVQNDHNIVENGHNPVENGHDPVENGHKHIENGHKYIENGHKSIENGHKSVKNGRKSIETGHKSVENGHNRVQYGHNLVENGLKFVENSHKKDVHEHKNGHHNGERKKKD